MDTLTQVPTDAISEAFARRLRDVERAGRLRLRLVAVEASEFEAARMCRYDLHDEARAAAHGRTARFCDVLYHKVVRLEARARGEAAL